MAWWCFCCWINIIPLFISPDHAARLFNVRSCRNSSHSSPPSSSASSQHWASLQQRTQGLLRPPRRATEGSLSLSLSVSLRHGTIQRTGQLSLAVSRMALPLRKSATVTASWKNMMGFWDTGDRNKIAKTRFKDFPREYSLFANNDLQLHSRISYS